MSIKVCSAVLLKSSLNLISKHILKQDCMISQTDSFVMWTPTGLRSNVLNTCNIFIKTTSSLLGSVPTKRAWVTASARLSIPDPALSSEGSISPYERNLFTDESATPVMGPVVSSDLMTSARGHSNNADLTSQILKSPLLLQTNIVENKFTSLTHFKL